MYKILWAKWEKRADLKLKEWAFGLVVKVLVRMLMAFFIMPGCVPDCGF